VGAWTAAVFHLFTHAFFKADLFLGAGSVSHSGSHHSFDMKTDMGGLKKYMPQTYKTFVIGTLALAGIFPLAGFWSKDEIIANAGHNDYMLFLVVGLVGAFMTAAYMTRCVYLTFHGEYRGAHAPHAIPHVDEAEHDPADTMAAVEHDAEVHSPHESNRLITTPLWVLSFFAVFAGFLNFPHFSKFEKWFDPHFPPEFAGIKTIAHPAAFNIFLAIGSVGLALIAIGIVWAYYEGRLPQGLSERNALAGAGKRFLVNKYYLDFLYEKIIVGGIKGPIAAGAYWFNQHVIDNVLNYAGKGTQVVGRFTYTYLDQKGVDGLVNGIGAITDDSGVEARKLQTGRLQFYALMLVVAVVIFAGALWIFT
jgi:NADH-quinone oxidoreductase subunit L